MKTIYRVGLGFALTAIPMLAGTIATPGGLPWEPAVGSLTASITGPVAKGVATIGIAGVFIDAMRHGELTTLGHRAGVMAIAGGGAVLASPVLSYLYTTAGAVI